MTDLELMTQGEQILWRGRPNKKCFLFEAIFNPMLIFATIWFLFDFFFIGTFLFASSNGVTDEYGEPLAGNEMKSMALFLLIFFAFHLMPVWIYLGGVITSFIKYKNTEYIVTERGIYVSTGVIAKNCEMKPFTDLAHISVRRGLFDNIFGVGDVVSVCGHSSGYVTGPSGRYVVNRNYHGHNEGIEICDIPDYQQVFTLIRNAQTDVYADTMYPNEYRPENNPGYNTSYNGRFQ